MECGAQLASSGSAVVWRLKEGLRARAPRRPREWQEVSEAGFWTGMRVCGAGTCRTDLSEAERTVAVDRGPPTFSCRTERQDRRCGDSGLRLLSLQGTEPHRDQLMGK